MLLKVGEVKAETFDELFEKTKALPWENYIPKNGKFWVAKANSIKSKLFSPSDIQSIMKKAIVERLKGIYGISWFPEDGPEFPIRVAFMKDVALIGIDTSGVSLHKLSLIHIYVLLGKGVGFGKKVSQRFEAPADCTIYRLAQETERGSAKELAKSVAPEFLEIADEILREAEKLSLIHI